jgi:phosphoglucosamine mutase
VRPSGTEPLIRVMVEAATHDLAQATAESLAEVVLARFG